VGNGSTKEGAPVTVVVFGSINMDLVARTPRLPSAGETLTGEHFFTAPGGKGANQAVAAARLGAPTRMVGRVGGDVFGETLRQGLRDDGVDVASVATAQEQPSGVALITVDATGENTIIVVPGANGTLGADDLAHLDDALSEARVLLLQLEVPLAAVSEAARRAHERGVAVVLDPAPARPLPAELYAATAILTPNAGEAATLVGFELDDDAAIRRAAEVLLERGAGSVVIKLGADGAYYHDGARGLFVPSYKVTAVDTVAAGDAFNGGLAAALHDGRPFEQAVRWGIAAGALAVTKAGAQPALPRRAALFALLNASP